MNLRRPAAADSRRPIGTSLRRLRLVALLLLTGLCCNRATGIPDRSSQRAAFPAAEQALARGETVALDEFRHYPLYPYLVYADLSRRLEQAPATEITAFLQTWGDTPPAAKLRGAWLRQLAAHRQWADYLQVFQPADEGDTTLACWRRQALLDGGRLEQALAGIDRLWLTPTDLPAACDGVFARWKAQGGMTVAQIGQRFQAALDKGQRRLAVYLAGQLPEGERATAELWLQVDENPRLVLEAKRFAGTDPRYPDILLYGLERWSRRDSVAAAEALTTLKTRYRLPAEPVAQLERQLALYFAARGRPDALPRLNAVPVALVDTEVREWRVRVGLQRADWKQVSNAIAAMPAAEQAEPRWRYWRARALEATGQVKPAEALYRQLAGERDYHGFLAADRLGLPYQFRDTPLAGGMADLERVSRRPEVLRAEEWYLLQRPTEAGIEWRDLLERLPADELPAVARLAHCWGWHEQAIVTLARAQAWDDLELRFPTPYREPVIAQAQAQSLDPAWIFGIIRQESIFRRDARSGVGALGLMQVLPATGKDMAVELQLPPESVNLLDPATNIQLGVRYLRSSLDKLQGYPVLATAAYNAGQRRVQEWLPGAGGMEADRWAETIPFVETRKYVQRVLEYTVIYGRRLGIAGESLSSRMRPIAARVGAVEPPPTQSGGGRKP